MNQFSKKMLTSMWSKLPRSLWPRLATVSVDETSFKVARPFETAVGRALVHEGICALDPETLNVFKNLSREAKVFFDIGANIGAYSAICQCVNPGAKVWAFEPAQAVYSVLSDTVTANGWRDVVAEPLALGDFDGETTLYVPAGDLEASMNPRFRADTTPQPCRVAKLDSYCQQNDLGRLDLLKIDTESTEPLVLAGGREVIGDCRPDIICEVLKGRSETALTTFLQPLGYRFYHLRPEGPILKSEIEGDENYRYLNYLFSTRKEVRHLHAHHALPQPGH